jgi:hypothetical protein
VLFGLFLVPLLAGWRTPMLVAPLSATAFLIWSIAGGTWVMRAKAAGAGTLTETEDLRHRRRVYLVSILPATVFLWRRLQEFNPTSAGEAILLPIMWIAAAAFYWWMFASIFWRFGRIMRASQEKRP